METYLSIATHVCAAGMRMLGIWNQFLMGKSIYSDLNVHLTILETSLKTAQILEAYSEFKKETHF